MKSTTKNYGKAAVVLHWLSAILILGMIPLGFMMQRAGEDTRLFLYRGHIAIGALVLLLTLARLTWKVFDTKVAPPPGLEGMHLYGMKAIHVFLYLGLLGLLISGVVLNFQSGLIDILGGRSDAAIPDLAGFGARKAHGSLARVYIGLLIGHIGGVIVHQLRHGQVFARMGIGRQQSGGVDVETVFHDAGEASVTGD